MGRHKKLTVVDGREWNGEGEKPLEVPAVPSPEVPVEQKQRKPRAKKAVGLEVLMQEFKAKKAKLEARYKAKIEKMQNKAISDMFR